VANVWILVADHARARLFSFDQDAPRMIEVADFVNPAARDPAREREHAPPPRVHDRVGESRHAIEPRTSPMQKAESQFAAMLVSHLKRDRDEKRYRSLVLVAPPRFLGALNAALDTGLGKAVRLRVPKNMTRSPVNEILEVLPYTLFRRRKATNG
jgi:protein required for attachment to host cells